MDRQSAVAHEIENVLLDIKILGILIDLQLDRGAGGDAEDDIMFRACRSIIVEKRGRLEELKQITLYVSRPPRDRQPPQ
jgi:hypothetical protein